MYHTIKFRVKRRVDLEVSKKHALESVLIKAEIPMRAQIKAYVVETKNGPVEVADLFFEDGTATRAVPFAVFSFVD
jgi:hypothetical protein